MLYYCMSTAIFQFYYSFFFFFKQKTAYEIRPCDWSSDVCSSDLCRVARPTLDTARYLILPFAHREGSQSSLLDGADCAEYLSQSFGRWSDVRLADRTRIYDALERRGARAPFRIGFGTGRAIARELGAGRLVMGQLWSAADTLRLTVGVYDAARGGPPLREAKARVAANSTH